MKQNTLIVGRRKSEAKPLDLSGPGQAFGVSLDSASGSCLPKSELDSSWCIRSSLLSAE